MLDGTLGNYSGSDYKIELKDNVKPFHTRPFPGNPKIYKETLKKEVERLIKIGVLKSMAQLHSSLIFENSIKESKENPSQFQKFKTYF